MEEGRRRLPARLGVGDRVDDKKENISASGLSRKEAPTTEHNTSQPNVQWGPGARAACCIIRQQHVVLDCDVSRKE